MALLQEMQELIRLDSGWQTSTGEPDPFPTMRPLGDTNGQPRKGSRDSKPRPCKLDGLAGLREGPASEADAAKRRVSKDDAAQARKRSGSKSGGMKGVHLQRGGGKDGGVDPVVLGVDGQVEPHTQFSLDNPDILVPPAPGCCGVEKASTTPPHIAAEQVCTKAENMVYVLGEIAGQSCELLVDTGAQLSVMTLPMVQRLGLVPYIDQSEMGVAAGVGAALILGRLRDIPVRLGAGTVQFTMDFAVLYMGDSFAMLGMDQMQRFKCMLDLERRMIVLRGQAGGVEVPFLPPRERGPCTGAPVEMACFACTVM